jgi:4-amino-4-deoxy-L-arabinose transferase-like glycosyltransferase
MSESNTLPKAHFLSSLPGKLFIISTAIALLSFLFYFRLGGYALLNNNEGLYAAVPREMLLSKNFIIPYLNGAPFFEKPPLFYWLIALSYKIFGISESSARFISASAGFLTCFSIFIFASRLNAQCIHWVAPFIIATSFGFIVLSRMVISDVLFIFLLSSSLMLFYLWFLEKNKNFLRYFYVFLAFAVLTRGFLAIALGMLIIGIFFLVEETSKLRIKIFFDPFAIGLFILFTIPWHIAAILQMDGFTWFYFMNEGILHFLGLRELQDYYSGPFYYYIPHFIALMFPWSFYLPLLFKGGLNQPSTLLRFCWIWLLVLLIFFLLSRSKANYYMLVGLPPIALLLASKIEYLLKSPKQLLLIIMASIPSIIILGFIAAGLIFQDHLVLGDYLKYVPVTVLFISGILISHGLGFLWTAKSSIFSIYLTGLLVMPMLYSALQIAPRMEQEFSTRLLLENVPSNHQNKIYLYREFEELSTIPFYARHRVKIFNSLSKDLAYGQHTRYAKEWFLTFEEFKTQFSSQGPIYIFLLSGHQRELKDLPLCLLGSMGNTTLLTNQCVTNRAIK